MLVKILEKTKTHYICESKLGTPIDIPLDIALKLPIKKFNGFNGMKGEFFELNQTYFHNFIVISHTEKIAIKRIGTDKMVKLANGMLIPWAEIEGLEINIPKDFLKKKREDIEVRRKEKEKKEDLDDLRHREKQSFENSNTVGKALIQKHTKDLSKKRSMYGSLYDNGFKKEINELLDLCFEVKRSGKIKDTEGMEKYIIYIQKLELKYPLSQRERQDVLNGIAKLKAYKAKLGLKTDNPIKIMKAYKKLIDKKEKEKKK